MTMNDFYYGLGMFAIGVFVAGCLAYLILKK